jgi:hypothetical protein
MKAGQLIVFFLTLYLLLGLTNYTLKGTPNGTNDFIAHYYKATEDFEHPRALEYYSPEFLEQYPPVFHFLAKPFVANEYWFYFFAVILIVLIAPALLYKLAGDFAVIIYFALSLPHMVLYNATFPSFVIMIYVLIYLLQRKNWALLLILTILSFFTHKEGVLVFGAIIVAELIEAKLKNKEFVAGLLVGVKASTPAQILMLLVNHVNFYFIWISRKSFTIFYTILFCFSFATSLFWDMRAIILAQIILCVLVAETMKTQKPSKKFWAIWVFCILFNVIDFLIGTEKFIFL